MTQPVPPVVAIDLGGTKALVGVDPAAGARARLALAGWSRCLSAAQVSGLGLTVSNGLTPSFWIYSVLVVVLLVSCVWMLFIPSTPHHVTVPAGGGLRPGDDAGAQVPTWHVARTEAYDMSGAPAPAPGHDWDIDDDDAERGEFDSYEEFGSDKPAGATVTPEVQSETCDRLADGWELVEHVPRSALGPHHALLSCNPPHT